MGPQGGGAGMPFVVSVKCSPDTRQDVAGLDLPLLSIGPNFWVYEHSPPISGPSA